MIRLIHTLSCLSLILILPVLAAGQEADPDAKKFEEPKLDYSYCRFDPTTIALMEQYIPRPIRQSLAKAAMHPRFLPVFMTALDVNFDDPKGPPDHKILYASNGEIYASFVVLRRGGDGNYTVRWTTQLVPPAPRVKLRAKDLNGDGKLDIIASARGGEPSYEGMIAFEFNEDGIGRSLVSASHSPFDPNAPIGIAFAVIDSLGHGGRPAIEVWQDDSVHTGADFIRTRLQFVDSARIFLPESVDTLKKLPYWCRSRRAATNEE